MQVLILFAFFAASQAAALLNTPALLSTGGSTQYRAEDNIGNYNFGYDEGHLSGGTFRKEAGDAFGNKVGSYGLRDADGRVRVVNYVADAAGFRADIKTNEPGVEPKDPAATTINKASAIASAVPAVTAYAAPAVVAYSAPAAPSVATYAAPAGPAVAPYAAPAGPAVATYAAPAGPAFATYAAPAAPSVATYAAPAGPAVATYAAPAAPAVAAYSAPAAPVVAAYSAPAAVATYAAAPAPLGTYAAAHAPLATYAASHSPLTTYAAAPALTYAAAPYVHHGLYNHAALGLPGVYGYHL